MTLKRPHKEKTKTTNYHIEFITTYGWMIIAALAIISFLAYAGVIRP